MKDLNKIILIGRLGNDPVRRETRNGTVVVNFSIATSRKLKQNPAEGQMGLEPKATEETVWHRIVVWGSFAETCVRYLKKGQSVFVEGAIRTHKYQDKDQVTRQAVEVHAENVGFLGGGRFTRTRDSEEVAETAMETSF